ncbi:MAG: hypothetical protein KIS76_09890 [Pyrinomonadaceae bacterium]|nr:hypothetical protein [Pyrinomonadaceae bacterium]
MNSVILFFIDGLGIGTNQQSNPFFDLPGAEPLAHFRGVSSDLPFDGVVARTDPRLGVDGRPQSASGQTTILTGVNAPKYLGKHKQGFPNEALRGLINEKSLFLQLKQKGIEDSIFANAYTPKFFSETPRWKSATTCAVEAAGIQFRRFSDLLGKKALFHDFTNRWLIENGFDIPLLTAQDAAKTLASLSEDHRFVLYEHFITDKIGHAQDFTAARAHLPILAEFVRDTVSRIDLSTTTFILTSDHGNIEDLSIRTHTLNDVPTIVWGRNRHQIAQKIKDLTDITPSVLSLLADE